MQSDRMNLTHQFLIAMPSMADPNFEGAVVYVCEHGAKGALGLVINKPVDIKLKNLFEKVELSLNRDDIADAPVYFGGPVQTERGFVLHQPRGEYNSSLNVSDEIALTTSKDVLEALAGGVGPSRMMVTLGYSGWGKGQLEHEIGENAWLTVAADPQIIFDTPAEQRFAAALGLLGVNPTHLTGQVGHA